MPARPPPSAATLHALLSPREKARRLQLQESTGPSAYSALAARDPANKRKNRYSDVVPYDRTRVKVADVDGPDGYLNASWIEELDGQRRWIAAQAPTPATMHTFFRLLLTSGSHVVVQLTAPVESGVRKADPYMPTAEAPAVTFTPLPSTSPSSAPPVTLRLVRQTWQAAEQATVSTLELASEGSPTKQVTHVYFAGWKDKGVPEGRDGLETLLRLIELVNRLNVEVQPSTAAEQAGLGPPVVVHCSAGVGRTGSFISLASLARLLPASSKASFPTGPLSALGPLPEEIAADPAGRVIDGLREQRVMSVETREQVGLVHDGCRALEGRL